MSRSIARTVQVLGVASIATILIATSRAQDVGAGAALTTGSGAANFQVLTSGPLHESFARPVVFGGVDAYYVSAPPPQLFEEVPPLQRPAGFSEWVPGYWSFEDPTQQQSWIWVSGTWRVPPPSYTWVPGYWNQSTRGWRYVSGYWALAASVNTEIDYLPAPPDPIDVGAVGTAPYADAIWAPGNWMWAGSNYSWRRGYFVHGRADWVWTPASYTWTPNGYVFQEAYWDHSLTRRGLLYAPVAFSSGTTFGSGFSYSPDSVINVGLFSDSLFVRPISSQYYFGDYYARSWWDRGVYPAFSFHMSRFGYDPLFAYASWQGGRSDPTWLDGRRTGFLNLQAHPEARPQAAVVAIAVKDVAAAKITPLEIETVSESGRQELVARSKERHQARAERIKLETQTGAAAEVTQPRKVKISKDLLPGAAESAKATTAMPDRPEIPKAETGQHPEAVKGDARRLGEPSMDRPVDHIGRAGGKPDPSTPNGAKPDGAKPNGGKPEPPMPKPDAGRPTPEPPKSEPPKRPDVAPPAPKPDAGRPAPQPPKSEPPKHPDVAPPAPKPDAGRPTPKPPKSEPPKRPDVAPPAPKPEGGKPQPMPPAKPDAGKPQPTPAPRPDGGKPAPSPSPKPGGKPDQKPPADDKPKLDSPDSRPGGSESLMS